MTSPLGLAKTKQQELFFVSPFVLLLAYACMDYVGSYAYAYDDPYVAGLTSFLCFAFCFAFMLMLSCEPGLIRRSTAQTVNKNSIVYEHFSSTRGISAIQGSAVTVYVFAI